jgi:hypothetical protein
LAATKALQLFCHFIKAKQFDGKITMPLNYFAFSAFGQ